MIDGLGKALDDAPIWVAIVGAIGGFLSAVGARKAGARIQVWAQNRYANGDRNEIVRALVKLEETMRSEGDKTRHAIYASAERTADAVHEIDAGVNQLLGRR